MYLCVVCGELMVIVIFWLDDRLLGNYVVDGEWFGEMCCVVVVCVFWCVIVLVVICFYVNWFWWVSVGKYCYDVLIDGCVMGLCYLCFVGLLWYEFDILELNLDCVMVWCLFCVIVCVVVWIWMVGLVRKDLWLCWFVCRLCVLLFWWLCDWLLYCGCLLLWWYFVFCWMLLLVCVWVLLLDVWVVLWYLDRWFVECGRLVCFFVMMIILCSWKIVLWW